MLGGRLECTRQLVARALPLRAAVPGYCAMALAARVGDTLEVLFANDVTLTAHSRQRSSLSRRKREAVGLEAHSTAPGIDYAELWVLTGIAERVHGP